MNKTAYERVLLARSPERLKATDLIDYLFDDFLEMSGDRLNSDDKAVVGGIAYFNNIPVTIIAQTKGKDTEDNIRRNFGMVSPQGYRKAIRLAKQAEKFNRPIITFIDTAGAYPGIEAEKNGQQDAIANCLKEFSGLNTVIIGIVISEGGSGGALAFSVCDSLYMLENAVYSILSPEGFASILFKDKSRAAEAAELMKLTSKDLKDSGLVDEIIYEDMDVKSQIRKKLVRDISKFSKLKKNVLLENRYKKFRNIGTVHDQN
jgi:acetyl-CoA carboxylase carboxyl transferase subunit alpha